MLIRKWMTHVIVCLQLFYQRVEIWLYKLFASFQFLRGAAPSLPFFSQAARVFRPRYAEIYKNQILLRFYPLLFRKPWSILHFECINQKMRHLKAYRFAGIYMGAYIIAFIELLFIVYNVSAAASNWRERAQTQLESFRFSSFSHFGITKKRATIMRSASFWASFVWRLRLSRLCCSWSA